MEGCMWYGADPGIAVMIPDGGSGGALKWYEEKGLDGMEM